MENESPPGSPITLHANDPNVAVNPRDHSDHRMAGLVAADLKKKDDWRLIYYVGYALAADLCAKGRSAVNADALAIFASPWPRSPAPDMRLRRGSVSLPGIRRSVDAGVVP